GRDLVFAHVRSCWPFKDTRLRNVLKSLPEPAILREWCKERSAPVVRFVLLLANRPYKNVPPTKEQGGSYVTGSINDDSAFGTVSGCANAERGQWCIYRARGPTPSGFTAKPA